jgi:uncharacterized protein YigE (DUF2233 family)
MISKTTFLLLAFSFMSLVNASPEKKVVDGVFYHILETQASSVRIIWKDKDGAQLRTFPEVARYLVSEGISTSTLINGGIFEPGGVPSGLLIQDGKELNPLNRRTGDGNFFLKPNGIFLIGSKGAAVVSTEECPLKDVKIQQAVQSGPLLLRHGKIHPQFNFSSNSRLHRNGVGVSKSGKVIFVMTDFDSAKFPNLYEFAKLFRNLGCEDALFLDGDLSQMKSGDDTTKPSNQFGSIIAVSETEKANKIK